MGIQVKFAHASGNGQSCDRIETAVYPLSRVDEPNLGHGTWSVAFGTGGKDARCFVAFGRALCLPIFDFPLVPPVGSIRARCTTLRTRMCCYLAVNGCFNGSNGSRFTSLGQRADSEWTVLRNRVASCTVQTTRLGSISRSTHCAASWTVAEFAHTFKTSFRHSVSRASDPSSGTCRSYWLSTRCVLQRSISSNTACVGGRPPLLRRLGNSGPPGLFRLLYGTSCYHRLNARSDLSMQTFLCLLLCSAIASVTSLVFCGTGSARARSAIRRAQPADATCACGRRPSPCRHTRQLFCLARHALAPAASEADGTCLVLQVAPSPVHPMASSIPSHVAHPKSRSGTSKFARYGRHNRRAQGRVRGDGGPPHRRTNSRVGRAHLRVRRRTPAAMPCLIKVLMNSPQRLQRRRDAMYELAERSAIYARQIEEVLAGGTADETLLRRLQRLSSSVSSSSVQLRPHNVTGFSAGSRPSC